MDIKKISRHCGRLYLLRTRRMTAFLIVFTLLIFMNTVFAYAGFEPYIGYDAYAGFDSDQQLNAPRFPNGYLPEQVVSGVSLGIGPLSGPGDFFAAGGLLYILDSGNNRLVVLDEMFGLAGVIDRFVYEGEEITLSRVASGIFVRPNGDIYIADTGNGRIVVSDADGNVKNLFGRPETPLISSDVRYQPTQVGVDSTGIIYICERNVNRGFITINDKGEFLGFYGAARLQMSAAYIVELVLRRFMTREQITQRRNFQPVAYSNFHVDSDDFIFATVSYGGAGSETNNVKKLNLSGNDVLPAGLFYGDQGASLRDIAEGENGVFFVLDGTYGRVYVCREGDVQIMAFGGHGGIMGTFSQPVAVEYFNGRALVLDGNRGDITVFAPTGFGRAVFAANELFYAGRYEDAAEYWTEVLMINSNARLAYAGLGASYEAAGEYRLAMDNYRLAGLQEAYGEVKEQYRRELFSRYFVYGLLVLLAAAIVSIFKPALYVLVMKKPYKAKAKQLVNYVAMSRYRYPLHIVFHPFVGYSEMKHNRKYSLRAANVILALWFFSELFYRKMTSFDFAPYDGRTVSIFVVLLVTLVIFSAAAVANWALCVLWSGNGRFNEIWVASAYALIPLVIYRFAWTGLSYVVTLQEGVFLQYFFVVAAVWTAFLVVAAVMEVHQYAFKQAIASIVVTGLGVAFIVFIALMVFSLAQQIILFATQLFYEISYKYLMQF